MTDVPEAATRLLTAITERDFDGMEMLMAPDVRFRYLVPGGPGERRGAIDTADRFRYWFGDAEVVETLDARVERLADRVAVGYRLRLREQFAWEVVQQQVYLDVDDEGRIATMDLLCTGFRPVDEGGREPSGDARHFDAGTMGCADGLAQEFRRRMLDVPPGTALVVETSDPAAKEDLPPLARMMGHRVRSIESAADGRLLITVERGQ